MFNCALNWIKSFGMNDNKISRCNEIHMSFVYSFRARNSSDEQITHICKAFIDSNTYYNTFTNMRAHNTASPCLLQCTVECRRYNNKPTKSFNKYYIQTALRFTFNLFKFQFTWRIPNGVLYGVFPDLILFRILFKARWNINLPKRRHTKKKKNSMKFIN